MKINEEKLAELLLKKAVFSSNVHTEVRKSELIKLFDYNAKDIPPIAMNAVLNEMQSDGIIETFTLAVNKNPYYIKLTDKWFMANLFDKTPDGVYSAIKHCGGQASRRQIADRCGYNHASTGLQNMISILQNRGLVERVFNERKRIVSYRLIK